MNEFARLPRLVQQQRKIALALFITGLALVVWQGSAPTAESAVPPDYSPSARLSLVSAQTGAPGFSIQANGEVRAIEDDGAGGFYVGGGYSCIGPSAGKVERASQCVAPNTRAHGLTRIRPDGSVDPAFLPLVEGDYLTDDVSVLDVARIGSTVYFTGTFWGVNGAFRTGAAAVSADGQLLPWAPRFDSQPFRIEANDRGNLFLFSGIFESVNGQSTGYSGNLVEITPAGDWTGFRAYGVYGDIEAVAQMGEQVYLVGGLYSGYGKKQKRRQAVALGGDGRLTSWNPAFESAKRSLVYAVERVGESLVFGGDFRKAKGKPRRGLAAFDASGSLTTWAPRLSGKEAVAFGITSVGSTAYVVGSFDRVDTARRTNAVAIDSAGQVTPWSTRVPSGEDWVQVLGGGQDAVLLGLWQYE